MPLDKNQESNVSLNFFLKHLIRSINDPEHPLTLEELNVVEQVRVKVSTSLALSFVLALFCQRPTEEAAKQGKICLL